MEVFLIAALLYAGVQQTWKRTDPGGTYSASRAAARSGVTTGARSAKATWNRRRPDRAKKREERRKRWSRSGLPGWVAVQLERGTVGAARLGVDLAAAGVSAGRDGAKAARAEWRTTWRNVHPEPTETGPDHGPDQGTGSGPEGGPVRTTDHEPDHPAEAGAGRCSWTVSPHGLSLFGVQKACGRRATAGPLCTEHDAESRRTPCVACGHPMGSNPECAECQALRTARGEVGPVRTSPPDQARSRLAQCVGCRRTEVRWTVVGPDGELDPYCGKCAPEFFRPPGVTGLTHRLRYSDRDLPPDAEAHLEEAIRLPLGTRNVLLSELPALVEKHRGDASPSAPWPDAPLDEWSAALLERTIAEEDDAEDRGMPADDRRTCHTCRAWSTPEHIASDDHWRRLGMSGWQHALRQQEAARRQMTAVTHPSLIPPDQRCEWCDDAPQETKRGKLAVCEPCAVQIDAQTVNARINHQRASGLMYPDDLARQEQPLYAGELWGEPIPLDSSTPCLRPGCGGTLRPIAGQHHFDADGSAMVSTRCDRPGCGIESSHAWTWDAPEDNGDEDDVWQDPPVAGDLCEAVGAYDPDDDRGMAETVAAARGCTYCGATPVTATNYRGERACAAHEKWLPEEPKPWTPPENRCHAMTEHQFPTYLPSAYVDGLSDLIGHEIRTVRCSKEAAEGSEYCAEHRDGPGPLTGGGCRAVVSVDTPGRQILIRHGLRSEDDPLVDAPCPNKAGPDGYCDEHRTQNPPAGTSPAGGTTPPSTEGTRMGLREIINQGANRGGVAGNDMGQQGRGATAVLARPAGGGEAEVDDLATLKRIAAQVVQQHEDSEFMKIIRMCQTLPEGTDFGNRVGKVLAEFAQACVALGKVGDEVAEMAPSVSAIAEHVRGED